MGLGTWLAAMMQPLAARVLMALGFSVVSVVGVTTVLDQIKELFIAQAMAIPAAGFQLALLAGVGPAMGIIFGAVATRLALWQIQNATKILGVA
jgi:hypothetical protein